MSGYNTSAASGQHSTRSTSHANTIMPPEVP